MKSAAAVLLLLVAASAQARDCTPQVRYGWIRLAPDGVAMPMLAGFGRIENRCPKPIVVESASSEVFGDVSLHRTSVVDGISRMRALPALPIAADAAATLHPGGLHLMLMQPTTTLKPGTTVRIVFRLQDGRDVRGDFVARRAAD
jgi:copper(I)-binding protein